MHMKIFSIYYNLPIQKYIQESLWVFVGLAGSTMAQLVLIKTTTNLIPVTEYGTFSILLIYALLIERTLMTAQAGITRYYCEAHSLGQLESFWHASRSMIMKPTQITWALGTILSFLFLIYGNLSLFAYVAILTPFTIFMGWNTALAGIQLAARNRRVHSLAQLSEPVFRLLFLVILVFLFGSSVESLLLAYLISSFLTCAALYILTKNFIWKEHSKSQSSSTNKLIHQSVNSWNVKIWTYSWPFALWGILTWFQQSSDRFSLEYTSGSESVGYYAVLFQIGFMPMILISSMVSNLITPVIFQRYSQVSKSEHQSKALTGKDSLLVFSVALTSLVTIVFALIACVWNLSIMQLVVSPDYLRYSYLLPLMVLGGGMTSIGQYLATKIMAEKRTKKLLIGNVAYSVFAIGANIYGSFHYGVPGVVVAVMLSSVVYAIIFYFLSRPASLSLLPRRL